jgi:hypothetical protein
MTATLNTKVEEMSISHAYSLAGIGGSEGCVVQLVADRAAGSADAVTRLELPWNAVRLRLDKLRVVQDGIEMAAAARAGRQALMVGANKNLPRTADTFLADLAVGLGAGQFAGGGLDGVGAALYNRLLEIQREAENVSFVKKYFRN